MTYKYDPVTTIVKCPDYKPRAPRKNYKFLWWKWHKDGICDLCGSCASGMDRDMEGCIQWCTGYVDKTFKTEKEYKAYLKGAK